MVRAAWLNSAARLVYPKYKAGSEQTNERRYSEFAAALTNGHDSRRDVMNTSAILTKHFGLVTLAVLERDVAIQVARLSVLLTQVGLLSQNE